VHALLEKCTWISVTVLLKDRRQARLSALNGDWACGRTFSYFPQSYLVLCARHFELIEILRSTVPDLALIKNLVNDRGPTRCCFTVIAEMTTNGACAKLCISFSKGPAGASYPCCQILATATLTPNPHFQPLPRRFSVSPPMVPSIQLLIHHIYTPSGVAEEGNVEAPEEPPSNLDYPNGSKFFLGWPG
jgi:hypothetical protein